jgi:hypothetical protein
MKKVIRKNKRNIVFAILSVSLLAIPLSLSSCYSVEKDVRIQKKYSDNIINNLLIFDESSQSIIGYNKALVSKRLSLPEQINGVRVKQIASNAFDGLKVEELNLSSSIQKIHDNSFINSEIDVFNFSNSNIKYLSPTSFNDSKISKFTGNIFKFNSEKKSIDGLLVNPKQDYLFIPDKIGESDVIEISANAFNYEMTGFRFSKVYLPKTLKKVGEKAFYKQSIEDLYISQNIQTIDDCAFAKNKIHSITIKGNNKQISKNAFEQDEIIKDIQVKESIEENQISDYIQSLGINQDKNFIFEKLTGTITGIIQEMPILYIPDAIDGVKVQQIEKGAFLNKGIKELHLSESIEIIKEDAFKQNDIKNIYIPKGVKKIGQGAFSYNRISEILFDKDSVLKSIGGFDHNKISGELNIPNNIEVIENSAFANNFISKFKVPSKTLVIKENAFINNSIKELRVPKNVKEIKLAAFANNFMNNVVFENNSSISYISGFNDNFIKGELDLSNLKNLQEIGTRAFESNSIYSLVLNKNIKTIETRAFKNNNIVRLKNLGTNTKLENNWK